MLANAFDFYSLSQLDSIYNVINQTRVDRRFLLVVLAVQNRDPEDVLCVFKNSISSEDELVFPDESAL